MEKIFFRKSGKGKPVLLIHGFCETHEIWNGFAEKLSEAFEVFAIDLPGFGDSPLPATPFTIQDVAKDLLNWIDQENIRSPFLVGHSLGGYTALAMAKQGQEKISGLCLFNSTPYPDSDDRKSNRNKVIEFVKKNGVDPFIDTYVPGLFLDKKHPAIPDVYKIARRTSEETLLAYTSAMRDRPSSIDFLKEFQKPLLTITGDNDSIISVESVREFGHLAKTSWVHILENTGHMGMFEQPDKALRILSDFMSNAIRA
ncbi:MAG TPA: alpha/beta hydrolase [Cyclobacteriaceae bacterium]|jgi:pimeloyl-ACP methyl ester carboxylesterase|nr:alpha/beta hydrolase [Cyclobacteriaceae bacterium]